MTLRHLLPSLLVLVVGFTLGATFVHAQRPGPKARVVKGADLCTRVAPHGKAWVTPWAEGQGAWIGRLQLAAGASVPPHRDPTEEYIHVLSGHGSMRIDGVTTSVGPGDTVFMPAGAEVSFTNGGESLNAVQVFAGPSPAAKYGTWEGCK